MSIKTNELQTITAPALTDTLLLANSAEGTAQLSLAQAAAFFGTELVKPANPVGAALSNKAALSVQETVEAKTAPYRSVTVAASELPAYIASLPRLLTERLDISVNAGHVPQTLMLERFYGPGFLLITGSMEENNRVLDNGIVVQYCASNIIVNGFDVRGSSVTDAVIVRASNHLHLQNLTVYGSNLQPQSIGMGVSSSRFQASNCTFIGLSLALYCAGSHVLLCDCGASDNGTGIAVEYGGLAMLSGSTPNLLGGTANAKWGGAIIDNTGAFI